jgi:DNA-binding winged helix-turn-helix (wHTH) protein
MLYFPQWHSSVPADCQHRREARRMRYVFADCVLDTQLYTLHRADTSVRLRPKVFHVLHYLLEHSDHMVSKDELCACVAWPVHQ